jgi:septum formation topological specificity factor MinE
MTRVNVLLPLFQTSL